jgi:effector-binding domain-containing protein
MYKIGEFSKLSFVTVQALRLYDDIGLLKPVKIDSSTGYRYYSAEQLLRINYIVGLKQLGLSLEDIALVLKDNIEVLRIKELLQLKRSDLKQRLQDEQNKLDRVEKLLLRLEEQGKMPGMQTVLKKVEPQLVASLRSVVPSYSGQVIGGMFAKLIAFVNGSEVKFAGPTMMIYNDSDYKEENADIEVAAIINKKVADSDHVKVYSLPALEQAASITYKGPYEEMGEAYSDIMQWIANHNYKINGLCRELYLVGPGDTRNPAEYVSEIQIPVINGLKD